MEFNQESVIAKFDHNKAELTKVVDESKMLTLTDPLDNKQVAVIKGKRIELRGYEIKIEKKGKEIREDAKTFITGVLDYEKELKSVTTPEILRLEGLEEVSAKSQLVEERKKLLPERKTKLAAIDPNIVTNDEELLKLGATEFQDHLNQQFTLKLEADRRKLEEEKLAEQKRQEDVRIAELARKEATEKVERDRLAAIESEAEEKRNEAQAKIDAENAVIAEEKRKIEAEKLRLAHEEEVRKAAEAAKLKAEQDAKDSAEREKAEAERKALEAKAEEARLAALMPEKECLRQYASMLLAVTPPQNLKTAEIVEKLTLALKKLNELALFLTQ